MNKSSACAICLFLAVCSSGASGADTCTDGLLPQQQETLLLQHQVSIDAEQGNDFLDSALQFIFGSDPDTANNSAPSENESSKDRSAAGNKSHAAGNSSKHASSSNKTRLTDRNASEKRTNHSNTSKNSSAASNVPLPRKQQLMFHALAAKLNSSRQALASADELMSDYKKQTALEIHYGEKAALAEAAKLDALHQMDRMLNESMSLERGVASNIPAHMKSRVLPHATTKAANRSFEASDAAAQAAKLAQVVHVAELNYSAAIAQAYEARRKRDVLSSTMLKFLNTSIADGPNLTRLVEAINSSFYLNLSGDTEIKAKGNASNGNLTDIVKADIERFSPPDTTTTTTITKTTTNSVPDDVPDDVPDSSVPPITVTIVNGSSDNGSDAKQD